MMRSLLLWASQDRWMRDHLARTGFVRRAVSRFMPGETAEAALDAAAAFGQHGLGAVLTLLGENVADARAAQEVVAHYAGVLERIEQRGLDAEISVKLTHLGLDLDRDLALANLSTIAAAAATRGRMLWVDMEGSAYTRITLELFARARAAASNLGLCLQAYLHRTAADLDPLLRQGAGIRLVKGAYAEPPSVAFARKQDVDENFFRLACRMLEPVAAAAGVRPVFGTHDLALIRRITAHATGRGLAPRGLEIHMLYGIQREEQERLARAGHQVRVLVSYGAAWFPWYMRRLAERPANLWFVVRNLVGR